MSSQTPSGSPQGSSKTIMTLVGVVVVAALAYFGVQYYNNIQAEAAAQAEMAAKAEADKAAEMAKEAEMAAKAEADKAAEMAKEAEMAAKAEADKAAEMAKEAEMAAKSEADKAMDMAKDAATAVGDKMAEGAEKATDMAKDAATAVSDTMAEGADMAKDAAMAAGDKMADGAAKVEETVMAAAGKKATPAIIYDLGGKFDKSFNEAGYNGATGWSEETGVPFLDLELQNDAQREQALRQFARRGANPIVVPGFSWGAALEKVAPEFPDTNFAIIDMVVDAPNVRSVVFNEHTGSFLVGALAALKSETGKVGFVGGMDIPLIHKFYCGYAQGAKAVNPNIEVYENYTGTTPAAWNDPVTAGELAKASFNRGADVVYAAAGGSGIGVLQAAADEGKFSIGVDSNQNYIQPGSVLTSMVKRVDVAVADAFQDQMDGNWSSGFEVMGLANDGVAYALDDNNKDLISADMLAKVEDLKAKIIAGEIVVHDYTSDGTCPL